MKILSYNIRGQDNPIRNLGLFRVVEKNAPYIILIQQTMCKGDSS
jgi:hypothetical protein